MYLSELCIFPTQQYPLDLRTESNAMKSYHKSSEKSLAILTGSTKIGFSTGSTADVKVVEKAVNQSARYSMEVPCIIYRFTGRKKLY